jgi:hypothetical protein
MPIVALAFHEHMATEKLNRYFATNAAGGESRGISCPDCSLAFAVVLVNREDTRNEKHILDLRTLIKEDCIGGLHRDEYTLAVETRADN